MNCHPGDYAYIIRGDYAGIVVEVSSRYGQISGSFEPIWNVRSRFFAPYDEMPCPDSILRPINRTQEMMQ